MTDRVGLGTTAAVSRAAEFLIKRRYPYRLRFGTELTFSQSREQPSLLLGGPYNSQWTSRMTRRLRFNFVPDPDSSNGIYVIDTQTARKWGPIITQNGYADQDYAILCRLFDSINGQIVFIAAGISTFGIKSAAEFLFNSSLFSQLVKGAPKNWETKDFKPSSISLSSEQRPRLRS